MKSNNKKQSQKSHAYITNIRQTTQCREAKSWEVQRTLSPSLPCNHTLPLLRTNQ